MSSDTVTGPGRPTVKVKRPGTAMRPWVGTSLGLGTAVIYLSVIVLLPLAALVLKSTTNGFSGFWDSITQPAAKSALELTLGASLLVAVINLVMGTLIAWVLVRDSFPGKTILDTLIDLPFALPTIVAGLVLLTLYGPDSPFGINVAFSRTAVVLALLFVTLPFVVRTVQPVLLEIDQDMEQAAASLGAGNWTIFRRIILPNLMPAMISGMGLAFTRSIAEYGSTVLLSGNLPMKTQVAAVQIYGSIENDDMSGAAAVSALLLIIALVVLLALDAFRRWGSRRG